MPTIGATELIIILCIVPFALLFPILIVIAFWKICSRVGFNGALGLLMLVPIANIILPLYIAFTQWPAFKQEPKQEVPVE